MKQKIFALLIVIVLVIAMLPVSALAYDNGGLTYSDNDYNKLVAFLEYDGGSGKNGEILNPGVYDSADPTTWTGVTWDTQATKRVTGISWVNTGIAGALDVSGFDTLVNVNIGANALTSLDASGCSALVELICAENVLTSLTLGTLNSLQELNCGNNYLTALDVSGCPALEKLNCIENAITSLTLGTLSNLEEIDCYTCALTSLDVSGCPALTSLACNENNLTSLTLGTHNSLEFFACGHNDLMSLDLSGCPAIKYIYCFNNALTSLDVSGCSALELLFCNNNDITALDLTACPLLERIIMDSNPCTALTAKNTDGAADIVLASNGVGGYVSLYRYWSDQYATATPAEECGFHNWTQASVEASAVPVINLDTGSTSYDLTANFITLDTSPGDGGIYTGGRATITPTIDGGFWFYYEDGAFNMGDSAYLSRDGNTFTGLQDGEVIVCYATGEKPYAWVTITIDNSNLPGTGQDFTLAIVLGAIAAGVLIAGFVLMMRKRATV